MREFFYREEEGEKKAIEVETDAYAYSQKYAWLYSIFVKFDMQNEEDARYEEFLDTKESIIVSMQNGSDAKYVGSRLVDGWVELYFYARDSKALNAHVKKLLSSLEYPYETSVVKDNKWKFYDLNLYPNQKEFAALQTKEILSVLKEEGDVMEASREVEYYVYFDTPSQKEKFLLALEDSKEFEFKDELSSDDFQNGVALRAEHPLLQKLIDEKVEKLFEMLERFGGYYEGWSTTLVTQEDV